MTRDDYKLLPSELAQISPRTSGAKQRRADYGMTFRFELLLCYTILQLPLIITFQRKHTKETGNA